MFSRKDRPQWDVATIKTLLAFRVRQNELIALIFINPLKTEAGQYVLTLGDCSGTLMVEDL